MDNKWQPLIDFKLNEIEFFCVAVIGDTSIMGILEIGLSEQIKLAIATYHKLKGNY